MSYQAVTWVLQRPIKPSVAKFLLVVLAHNVRASDAVPWRAFASVESLVKATGQDRKTVMSNLERLTRAGWLRDTGERTGATKLVPIYEIAEPDNSTKSGTDTPIETVPNFPANGTNFPGKQYQISHETVPKLVPIRGNKEEQQEEKKKNKPPARTAPASEPVPSLTVSDLQTDGVSQKVATEFLALRKRKRAPLTAMALEGIRREADTAGWTLEQALRRCVERGWQGFDASWVQTRSAGASRQEEAEADHQRFLQLVGNEPSDDGRTIDVGENHATH